jgi:serine/threonine-protein kinase HipA
MTSKRKQTRCFVYICLPGQTEFVTAARFDLSGNRQGQNVGRLVYGRSYLARQNAVELDPVELRLREAPPFETALNGGVFGALRDASPDYWGRLVIQRALGSATLTEMDYLLNSPNDRAGALAFGLYEVPPPPVREFNQTLDLKKLQEVAAAIADGLEKLPGPEAKQAQRLMELGTSMGGARPKAVVEDRTGLWIAKFPMRQDRWNYARVEHAMLKLARECGIETAESKVVSVGGKDTLLVKRFDREKSKTGYLRHRMISALTLLQSDDSIAGRARWSYPILAEEVRRVCANSKRNATELFKRMCFNALTSNLDDHPRNHAIIAKGGGWELSPAYDLTPSPTHSTERDLAMAVGGAGRAATALNLLSESHRFLLSLTEAEKIISEMQAAVASKWYATARAAKVILRDCETIRPAFENEGFAYPDRAA